MREDLIERLRSYAEAYPEDIFGVTTDDDRKLHGEVVQRAAATMGRHMAPLLRKAAAAIEAAREDAERLDALAALVEAQPERALLLHHGRLADDRYHYVGLGLSNTGRTLRQAIDQARGKAGPEAGLGGGDGP